MRVKRGVKARRRRNRVFEVAKGFVGRSGNTIRQGTSRAEKSKQYAYRDRKVKKRDFRSLWIVRLNAAARKHGLSYSRLIAGLKAANVQVDRKILSAMGAENPQAFQAVVELAKSKIN